MPDRIVMTKDEAEQYHWLIQEIASCRQRIKGIEAEAEQWADYPNIVNALSENRAVLEEQLEHCEAQCERFEAWITTVSDPQIQSWLYLRCVDGLSWVQIAAEAHMKSDTVRTAVYRFFAKGAA